MSLDPTLQLVLLFVLMHVLEGGLWVRRNATIFVRRFGRYRRGHAGVLGNDRFGFAFLEPYLPSPLGFVVDDPALLAGPLGFVEQSVDGRLELLDSATFSEVVVEGRDVLLPGRRKLRFSTSGAARALAAQLRAFSGTGDESPRPEPPRAGDAGAFDVSAVRDRLRELRPHGRVLAPFGAIAFLAIVGGIWAVLSVPWAFARWPVILSSATLLWLGLLVATWKSHRSLYPERGGERWLKLMLLALSPGAAARANAFVARDLLDRFHPLTVGCVVLSKEHLLEMASTYWRELQHPLSSPDSSEPAMEAASAARAELERAYRALLEGASVDIATLEQAPEPEGEDARAYCPRCHGQYSAEEATSCEDCPGVALVPFPGPVA